MYSDLPIHLLTAALVWGIELMAPRRHEDGQGVVGSRQQESGVSMIFKVNFFPLKFFIQTILKRILSYVVSNATYKTFTHFIC